MDLRAPLDSREHTPATLPVSTRQRAVSPHQLEGFATVRRVGWWRFPAYELTQHETPLASLGRAGWFRIFLGRGQRVQLPDGTRWRLRAASAGGDIWPLIVDDARRKVAVGGASHGAYGINTRNAAYVLYAADRRRFGRRKWILRRFEDDVGVVMSSFRSIETFQPVPLGVVLLSFVLARYGLPSDCAPKVPSFNWA